MSVSRDRILILAAVGFAWAACGRASSEEPAPRAEGARSALALQKAFVRVSEKVSRAVVAVRVERETLGRPPEASGVIFDAAGLVVTNEHVVRGAKAVTVRLPNGQRREGKVTGADPRSDLAVIKFEPPGELTAIEWGDSDKVRPGQWAIAVGNPFGFSNTVTVGVVSAVNRPLPGWALESLRGRSGRDVYYGSLIQTDAAINPGNSGGALVDLEGKLIGLNSLIGADIRTGSGVGFAIPANLVRRRVGELKAGKDVRYGWLGVRLKDLAGPIARAFAVADGEGVLVDDVVKGSPAAKAGLLRGQVITAFAGHEISSTDELVLLVGAAEVGAVIELGVRNPNGESRRIKVTIGERRVVSPPEIATPEPVAFRGWRGLVVAEVEGAGGGVPVADVQPGSPAARAGLAPGDRVDEAGATAATIKAVNGQEHFEKAVSGLTGPVLLHCVRLGYVVVKEK